MINVGIVGCGYWGPNIIRNFIGNGSVKNIYCCDLSEERLAQLKLRFPSIILVNRYEDLLRISDLDAVAIATPISTHYALGMAALEVGKHVYIEKPLATKAEEAEKLIKCAERFNRILMVGHTFEFSPPVLKIKELLDQGELGNLHYISSTRVNLGIHQSDVSVIWDLAPHDFSVIFYWLSQLPKKVSAMGRDCAGHGVPDVAFINMEFPNGALAQISISWLSPTKLRRMTLVGNKKMLVYDDMESLEKVKIFDQGINFSNPEDFGQFQLSYRTGDIVSPKLPTFEPLNMVIKHFIECIEKGQTPKTDGYNGLNVVRVIEAAERSLKKGGEPVSIAVN